MTTIEFGSLCGTGRVCVIVVFSQHRHDIDVTLTIVPIAPTEFAGFSSAGMVPGGPERHASRLPSPSPEEFAHDLCPGQTLPQKDCKGRTWCRRTPFFT